MKAIIILGMHRSGTSALAGTLYQLGLNLGDNLMRPEEDSNELGFYENYDLVVQHDRILKAMNASWQDSAPLPLGWTDWPEPLAAQAEINRLVEAQFADAMLWGVKDPRMCRLLPIWRHIFDTHAIEPHYVIVFRNPVEVAASLKARDGLDEQHALMLWFAYTREAERYTRGQSRIFLSYDKLLVDWRHEMKRLEQAFALTDWRSADVDEQAIDSYLSPTARHHTAVLENSMAGLPTRIGRFVQLLRDATRQSDTQSDTIFSEFEAFAEPDHEHSAAWWRADSIRWRELAFERGRKLGEVDPD